jgi:hypothetical protein
MALYKPTGEVRGMVRNPDQRTSILAAQRVRRVPIREYVLDFAKQRGDFGFIDEDLLDSKPGQPESSLRTRRNELMRENWIVDSGHTRVNRRGQEMIVWVHRHFHPSPPPIIEREVPESPREEVKRLRALLDAHGIAY